MNVGGVQRLADVVIEDGDARQERVAADLLDRFFRQIADDHAVVVGAGRVLREAAQQRLAGVREFEQLEGRDDAEEPREHRHADEGDPGAEDPIHEGEADPLHDAERIDRRGQQPPTDGADRSGDANRGGAPEEGDGRLRAVGEHDADETGDEEHRAEGERLIGEVRADHRQEDGRGDGELQIEQEGEHHADTGDGEEIGQQQMAGEQQARQDDGGDEREEQEERPVAPPLARRRLPEEERDDADHRERQAENADDSLHIQFRRAEPERFQLLDRVGRDQIALADDHLILQHGHLHIGHGGHGLLLPRARLGGILRHIRDDVATGEIEGEAALRRAQGVGAGDIHLQLSGGFAARCDLPVRQGRAERQACGILHPQPGAVIESVKCVDVVRGEAVGTDGRQSIPELCGAEGRIAFRVFDRREECLQFLRLGIGDARVLRQDDVRRVLDRGAARFVRLDQADVLHGAVRFDRLRGDFARRVVNRAGLIAPEQRRRHHRDQHDRRGGAGYCQSPRCTRLPKRDAGRARGSRCTSTAL